MGEGGWRLVLWNWGVGAFAWVTSSSRLKYSDAGIPHAEFSTRGVHSLKVAAAFSGPQHAHKMNSQH